MLRPDIRLEPPANLGRVHARHHDVQQNHIRQVPLAELKRCNAIACSSDLKILSHEPLFEQLQIGQNVVDDEDPRR